jgi:hypothetical protein
MVKDQRGRELVGMDDERCLGIISRNRKPMRFSYINCRHRMAAMIPLRV